MKAGRLRVIAVSTEKRLPNFPDIPAVSETLPGFAFKGWFALMAPAGIPNDVISRLSQDVNEVLKNPEIRSRLLGFGIYDAGGTPENLARFIRVERENFAKAVKLARIEPE
jgi:tripartite-type tricarboxylate transporter receptor subunit TctC